MEADVHQQREVYSDLRGTFTVLRESVQQQGRHIRSNGRKYVVMREAY